MAASPATSGPLGADLKKMMTGEQLFAGLKSVRKTKAWLERAKVTLAAAREQATEMAMAREKVAPQRVMRPTVLQRRRLAKRLSSTAMA
jgi:hypothetical protein